MNTQEDYDNIINQVTRIEDMLIVLLDEITFVDGDLVKSAKKRLIKAEILTN